MTHHQQDAHPDELSSEELEQQSAEALPDREAMSLVTDPTLGPVPLDDSFADTPWPSDDEESKEPQRM